MTKPLLNGLILNGGASSRMGSPKAEIQYHNKPQHQYLFELLTARCHAVYFSVKRKTDSFPYPQIADQLLINSPLNGIYSAFKFLPTQSWLVVAIDMPLLNDATLNQLILQRDLKRVATCFYDSSGKRPEPLVSIWEPAALPVLETFIEKGGISPRNFLEANDIRLIPIGNKDALLNINSKTELEMFRKRNQKS